MHQRWSKLNRESTKLQSRFISF